MKTSNKILLGAFIIIVLSMIVGNMRLKSGIDEVKNKQGIGNEQNDSTKENSRSVKVHLNF